jgi:hypothetical protein
MPIQSTTCGDRAEHGKLALVEVGHGGDVGLDELAVGDPPIEVEHVGRTEDDAGGGDERDPGVGLIGAHQAQELADEAGRAGSPIEPIVKSRNSTA